ncbi:MAG: hypothetical protein BWX78_01224 [Firmicutes bacterium ADurb.Bin099]|nr:MAG: hypothetical protein BWX78_01224 [Firmicutes bacterium ADurb.Bin099]
MSNSIDKLRTLKKMDFKKEDDLFKALQVLLNIKDTTFGIRNDAINVYYYGDSLMQITCIKVRGGRKALSIKFDACHFRYYEDKQGVYSKKDKDFIKWDEEWKKIVEALEKDLGEFIINKSVKLNIDLDAYPEKAKQAYKDNKDRPDWSLRAHIHNTDKAVEFINNVCEPILKKAVEYYVKNHYKKKEKSNELRYAQDLFRHNGWEQFSKGSLPSLFFSDSEFRLPNNERPLLKKEPATEEMLKELDAWPDKIFNDAKKITLPGSLDGVGAFRNEDGEVVPCFIEVKNGIGAYDGDSGIQKHLRDMVILAKHTIEDRKKEIDFSYSYRKKIDESNGGHIDWSKTGNPLILFILRHESIEEVIDKLEKVISKDYVEDVREHIKEVDVEFVITEKSDGTDFITCYKNKDRRFTLKELHERKIIVKG